MTLEIAIDMFLVTKQCQLNLNFETKKDTGTIDIFDYQTANAGTSPPPTPPFLQGDQNQRFLSEKKQSNSSKHLIF